jgi:acyl-CoA thioesterase FadM
VNLYLRLILTWIRGRVLPRLGPWDTHVRPMRVLPNDLDLLGHMNNGRYPTVLDLGRIEQMYRTRIGREMKQRGAYFVVAALTVSFRRSLMPWQRYDIRTRFLGATASGTYVEQTFVGVPASDAGNSTGEKVGEKIYAHAVVRLRALKKDGGVLEDRELAEIFGPAPEGVEVPGWVVEWSRASREAARNLRP